MSDLLDLQAQLQDTSQAIARSEQAVALDPSSKAASAALRSFEKRRQRLEHDFSIAAKRAGTDICSYRFFSDSDRQAVTPLCSALIDFQALYSLAYDAIKTGPKKRGRRVPQDVAEEASFFFGYTFAGSVGVVLTLDNGKVDMFGTTLDESIEELAKLANSRSSADVIDSGRRLGVPTVRAAHKWASTHACSEIGAEIAWKKGDELRQVLFLEPQSFAELAEVIGSTTETIEDEIEVEGLLLGADIQQRRFHLQLPDGGDIRGGFTNLIDGGHKFEVARRTK